MRAKRAFVLVASLFIVVAVGIWANGTKEQGAAGGSSSMSSSNASTQLTWSYWGDPGELPPFETIIRNYEAQNPAVTINVEHAPWSSYFTKIDTEFAAKTGPDVLFLTNIPTYASRGVLEPLDSYVSKYNFPIDQYNQEFLRIWKVNGHLYGFPRDNNTAVLYYNRTAFGNAGISTPDQSWNFENLLNAAQKLTKMTGSHVDRYGIALESDRWPLFVVENGGKIFDDNLHPTKFMLGEPAALQAIQFYADLINKYHVAPSFQEMNQIGGTTQLFASGQAAMTITNAARLGTFKDIKDFQWGVAPLPTGPTGIRTNAAGGAGFVMNTYSKQKDAAWKLLAYIAGERGQSVFASSGTAVPAMYKNAEVAAAFNVPSSDVFLKATDDASFAAGTPQFAGYPKIASTIVNPALDLVWTGEESAKDAITPIVSQVNDSLKNTSY